LLKNNCCLILDDFEKIATSDWHLLSVCLSVCPSVFCVARRTSSANYIYAKVFWNFSKKFWRENSNFVGKKVKVKVLPIQATKSLRTCRGIALPNLRPRHWRWGWVVSTTPRPFYPRYPLYRRLGGPQDRSGGVREISPPPGLDPRTVQPVASRYTDWAIPAPNSDWYPYETGKVKVKVLPITGY
jgi:hypothetical protein